MDSWCLAGGAWLAASIMKTRVIATAELVHESRPRLESDAISSMFTSQSESPGRRTMQRTDKHTTHHVPRAAVLILVLAVASAGAYFAYDQYQLGRLAGVVRRSFAAHRYD